jgi:hypothetical protein
MRLSAVALECNALVDERMRASVHVRNILRIDLTAHKRRMRQGDPALRLDA